MESEARDAVLDLVADRGKAIVGPPEYRRLRARGITPGMVRYAVCRLHRAGRVVQRYAGPPGQRLMILELPRRRDNRGGYHRWN